MIDNMESMNGNSPKNRECATLSIVVPAYNAEKTLDRCLESIVGQSFSDWNLILVDDGSNDLTPQCCNRWAERDCRISVVHQQNKGLSGARNAGISKASSPYITFVDADDTLEEKTLEGVMSIIKAHPEYDILEYNLEKVWPDGRTSGLRLTDKTFDSPVAYWLRGEGYTHCYACNKVFRRPLFDEVSFPEGVLFEDVYAMSHLLPIVKTVATTSVGTYRYMQNEKGITHSATAKEQGMLLSHHVEVLNELMTTEPVLTDLRPYMNRYFMHCVDIQLTYSALSQMPPTLPEWSVEWNGCKTTSAKLKFILLKIIGLNGLCHLYSRLNKLFL